jgi:hypothetical protein
LIYLFKTVIFHSYLNLPEGIPYNIPSFQNFHPGQVLRGEAIPDPPEEEMEEDDDEEEAGLLDG